MIKRAQRKIVTAILNDENKRYIILGVGVWTFLFGFLAGALFNFYLIVTKSPEFASLRTSLDYKSSIFGDGIILPVINMFAVAFLLRNSEIIKKKMLGSALFFGFLITLYFHVSQAVNGLVNWAMPEPWKWNGLGVFHALYMYIAASFISLFYIVVIRYAHKNKRLPKEAVIVTVGAIIFLILLRLDYIAVSLSSMLPQF